MRRSMVVQARGWALLLALGVCTPVTEAYKRSHYGGGSHSSKLHPTPPIDIAGQSWNGSVCYVQHSRSRCALDKLTKVEPTLVYPGGDTQCLSGNPYAFQVYPGGKDKVLFYFQGEGGCSSQQSVDNFDCAPDILFQANEGPFDVHNRKNPFRGYTIVQLLDCSGDTYAGNVSRPWTYNGKTGLQQAGRLNFLAALEWTRGQQRKGRLSAHLSELVIMGCSAGSIGLQLWAKTILSSLRWHDAAIIADSYLGIFPQTTDGQDAFGLALAEVGFCDAGTLSLEQAQFCAQGLLSLPDITRATLHYLRDQSRHSGMQEVPFVFYQSKTDAVQIEYYDLAVLQLEAAGFNGTTGGITDSDFYRDVNRVFLSYSRYPSFSAYLVDGQHHCFTEDNTWYHAGPKGPTGGGTKRDPSLIKWTDKVAKSERPRLVCEGKSGSKLPPLGTNVTHNTYCYKKLVGSGRGEAGY